jgi:hypothetical protein
MNEQTARAMIIAHFDASNVSAAGGGLEDNIVSASEIYADDAVVEWPQGGERLRGKQNIIAFRSTYPARQHFELHRITGCHDLWVNEYTIRYDDQPVMVVGIMNSATTRSSASGSTSAIPGSRRPGAPNGSSGSTLGSRTRSRSLSGISQLVSCHDAEVNDAVVSSRDQCGFVTINHTGEL